MDSKIRKLHVFKVFANTKSTPFQGIPFAPHVSKSSKQRQNLLNFGRLLGQYAVEPCLNQRETQIILWIILWLTNDSDLVYNVFVLIYNRYGYGTSSI